MSNEEMVVAIQNGRAELMEQLWLQLRQLVGKIAANYITRNGCRGGVTFDDLVNTGYLALVDTIPRYDPAVASFSTYFAHYLTKHFHEASGRLRTDCTGNVHTGNALDYAASLNVPVGEDIDEERIDLVVDPRDEVAAVEDRVFFKQLRDTVAGILQDLPEDQASALRCRFWDRLTYAQTAEKMGVDFEAARGAEHKAIGQLRRSTYRKMLLPFYDFNYYACTGLGAFRNSGMSAQERYVVRKEHLADQYIRSAVRAQKPS